MKTPSNGHTKPATQLWGIYYAETKRRRAERYPLQTVVEASSKHAAEEHAARLGFGNVWVDPITVEEAEHAQWQSRRQQRTAHRSSHRRSVVDF